MPGETTVTAPPAAAPETPPVVTPPASAPVAAPPAVTAPPASPQAAPDAPTSLLGAAKVEPKPGDPPAPVVTAGAPEKYADFKLPEGVTLDAALLEKASPLFKELGLTQDAAQKLVTLQAESSKAGMEAIVQAAQAQRTAFLESEKAATLKALGQDFKTELAFAAKALDKFGSPELRSLMDQTGFGMNLKMTQFMIAVGKAMAEDGMPGPAGTGPQDTTERTYAQMFPSMHDKNGNLLPEFVKK